MIILKVDERERPVSKMLSTDKNDEPFGLDDKGRLWIYGEDDLIDSLLVLITEFFSIKSEREGGFCTYWIPDRVDAFKAHIFDVFYTFREYWRLYHGEEISYNEKKRYDLFSRMGEMTLPQLPSIPSNDSWLNTWQYSVAPCEEYVRYSLEDEKKLFQFAFNHSMFAERQIKLVRNYYARELVVYTPEPFHPEKDYSRVSGFIPVNWFPSNVATSDSMFERAINEALFLFLTSNNPDKVKRIDGGYCGVIPYNINTFLFLRSIAYYYLPDMLELQFPTWEGDKMFGKWTPYFVMETLRLFPDSPFAKEREKEIRESIERYKYDFLIPNRVRAIICCVPLALLYFTILAIVFEGRRGGSTACYILSAVGAIILAAISYPIMFRIVAGEKKRRF